MGAVNFSIKVFILALVLLGAGGVSAQEVDNSDRCKRLLTETDVAFTHENPLGPNTQHLTGIITLQPDGLQAFCHDDGKIGYHFWFKLKTDVTTYDVVAWDEEARQAAQELNVGQKLKADVEWIEFHEHGEEYWYTRLERWEVLTSEEEP